MISDSKLGVNKKKKYIKYSFINNHMKKRSNFIILMLLACLVLISASPDFYFKVNTDSFLRVPCVESNEAPCSSTELVNISINYPNGSVLIDNKNMYYTDGGIFVYNLTNNDTRTQGIYTVTLNKLTNNNSLARFEYEVNGAGIKPSTERSSAQTRGVWVLFAIGALLILSFLFLNMNLPVRLSLLLFGIIFIVAGLNVVFVTMREEAVSPELIGLFDGLSTISFIFLWFAGGFLVIMWIFTFLNTWFYNKNIKRFNKFGYG